MQRIYLDWAAAAPVRADAARAHARALGAFGNPSSPHAEGRSSRTVLEDARTRIARLAGTKPDAVLFTGGATEANALAIVGQLRERIAAGTPAARLHVLYRPGAHASIRGAVAMLEEDGVIAEPIPMAGATVDLVALAAALRPETVLVAIEAVCGETGARFDLRGVRTALDAAGRAAGNRILLHADASQLPLVESFERTRLAADTVALDAQKVGGVRGIGALVAPRTLPMAPLMRGGGQERGLRPGTEPAASAAAFAAALEGAAADAPAFAARARADRERVIAALQAGVPDLVANGGNRTAPHILNVSFPERDTDYLAALLDRDGVAVSNRSACDTDNAGSAAVQAMTGDAALAASTLRLSWGPSTPSRAVDRAARAVVRAVRFLDANSV